MRAMIFTAVLGLAACSPSIAPGSYECGPEELCPEGERCNGPDAVCVTAAIAQPFDCGTTVGDVEPNDTLAAAVPALGTPECVSLPASVTGCVADGDNEDWFVVPVKSECTNAVIDARVTFPIAFEPVVLEVRDANGTLVVAGTDCPGTSDSFGEHATCLKAPVAAGGTYAVRISRAGTENCNGACSHNRYTASLQLTQGP